MGLHIQFQLARTFGNLIPFIQAHENKFRIIIERSYYEGFDEDQFFWK